MTHYRSFNPYKNVFNSLSHYYQNYLHLVFQNGNISHIVKVCIYAIFIKGYKKGNYFFFYYSLFCGFILKISFKGEGKVMYTKIFLAMLLSSLKYQSNYVAMREMVKRMLSIILGLLHIH